MNRMPIEDAYAATPVRRLHGCQRCNVGWFGAETRCWVCGGTDDAGLIMMPAAGLQSWSPRLCPADLEDAETAALLHRVDGRF